MKNYIELVDEELVKLSHDGDELALEYLIERYKYFVRSKARSYFLVGADHEDIIQEGMIGLYKAARDYKEESSFRSFAELCITRQMITAIKTATRQKHIPLNSYVSLNKPAFDDDSERTVEDALLQDCASDPEELIINQENVSDIENKLNEMLSPLEKKVMVLYLEGKSYVEIGELLGRHTKSVDNALQRVKRKLEIYLKNRKKTIDKC